MYWMFSGNTALRQAMRNFIGGYPIDDTQIGEIREYLKVWINEPGFQGEQVIALRQGVAGLDSRAKIKAWLDVAQTCEIDPL